MCEETLSVLDRLFTLTFKVDKEMRISRVSSRLRRLCPQAQDGSRLLDVFECHRPAGITDLSSLMASEDSLFLLISRGQRVAIRGQMIRLSDEVSLHFVGMPWLAWMNERAPKTKLNLGDFPKLDSQMDQEFYQTSQQSMVRDLEELAQKLTIAEEEAKEANRVQSDLFAVMSHEMRTPLNGVISALSLLDGQDDPLEEKKLTSIANESANNLMSVINYTLDYSKINAGRMTLQEQDFSIGSLMDSVIAVSNGRAKEKGLSLSCLTDPGVIDFVRGDSEKLRQILINVVGNAIKFTDHGEVLVRVTVDTATNKSYRFVVSDTGSGISKEDLGYIFDPFWGKSAGNAGSSTGLGLNIVKRLVELMSGSVSAESVPGEGTTFTIDIPLSSPDNLNMSASGAKARSKLAMPDEFRGNVLLVDDNQTNLMLGKMTLEKHGATVRTATNGKEAIDITEGVSFDLVLMDIAMPIMDGVSATKRINQRTSPPPVVALTANVGDGVEEQYLEEGFSGYLKKPLEQQALITVLNLWLQPASLAFAGDADSARDVSKASVLEALARQVGGENYERVKRLFLEETGRRINFLLSAWVRRDLAALRKEAHTLSSSVASFGCEDLAWRLKKIERASSENDVREIIKYMKDIETVSTNALEAVTRFSNTEELHDD